MVDSELIFPFSIKMNYILSILWHSFRLKPRKSKSNFIETSRFFPFTKQIIVAMHVEMVYEFECFYSYYPCVFDYLCSFFLSLARFIHLTQIRSISLSELGYAIICHDESRLFLFDILTECYFGESQREIPKKNRNFIPFSFTKKKIR